jgi:hypothetical protein
MRHGHLCFLIKSPFVYCNFLFDVSDDTGYVIKFLLELFNKQHLLKLFVLPPFFKQTYDKSTNICSLFLLFFL